jgi:ATP-dependent Clp protease, protease subunit
VIDLCALAGLPLQARRFLETGASLDEVRAALLDLRADATPELTALHPQPSRPADARPWGEVIARTFKSRG